MIDLKETYFHIYIVHQHRKFLRFAFRGKAYQYRVLPFGQALSFHTFMKCLDAALAPLRLQGIRILNYIDDWLIIAQSEQLAVWHWDVILAHMKDLELRLNAKKSVLPPVQRTTYLGVVWDSTTMQAYLSPAHIESILAIVKREREKASHSLWSFFKSCWVWWQLHSTWSLLACCTWNLCSGGSGPQGFPWGATHLTWWRSRGDVYRPHVKETIVPVTRPCARGSMPSCNANDVHLPHWLGSGHEWHINCLEMLAVFQALKHFLLDPRGHHVLVRTDNTSVVSYINCQGGLCSRPLYRLACQILLWAQGQLLSLRAVYIPGYLNQEADILSRQGLRPRE